MHWNNWDSAADNQLPKPGRGSKPRVRLEFNWGGGGSRNWPEPTWIDNSTEEEEPTIDQNEVQPLDLTKDPQSMIHHNPIQRRRSPQLSSNHPNWQKIRNSQSAIQNPQSNSTEPTAKWSGDCNWNWTIEQHPLELSEVWKNMNGNCNRPTWLQTLTL